MSSTTTTISCVGLGIIDGYHQHVLESKRRKFRSSDNMSWFIQAVKGLEPGNEAPVYDQLAQRDRTVKKMAC
jgi:hypothetical protein